MRDRIGLALFTQAWFQKMKMELAALQQRAKGKVIKLRVACRSGEVKEYDSIGGVAEHGVELRFAEGETRTITIMRYDIIEYVEVFAEKQGSEALIEMPLIGFGAKIPQKRDSYSI